MENARVIDFDSFKHTQTPDELETVYEQINRFLIRRGRNSEHTKNAYERDIKYFFEHTRGKKLIELKKNDLTFTINELEDFQTHLIDTNGLSTSTVNRYLNSIRECFRHLYRRNWVDSLDFLSIGNLQVRTNSYDGLTTEEVEQAIELVSNKGRKITAKTKGLLIKFAMNTCLRRSECLNLTWDDLHITEDEVVVHVVAKGGEDIQRKIPRGLYEELLEIKQEGSKKVFNIGISTVDRMMNDIRKGLKINENIRNIVFHSFRKAGAQYIYETTGDINEARKALNHESVTTTEGYLQLDKDWGVTGYYEGQESNNNLYKDVDLDTIVKAIESLSKNHKIVINAAIDNVKKV